MQVQVEKGSLMSKNPFNAFIDLISLDQEIKLIQEKIKDLKNELATTHLHEIEMNDRLATFKNHVQELRKTVQGYERKIKEYDEQEREKKGRLDETKNLQEYQAAKKEIDRIKQAHNETENQLLTIWNKLEIAQKEFDEQTALGEAKIKELHQKQKEKETEITSLEKKHKQKINERPEKESAIPGEWLEKYTHMRSQVDDPVVPILRGSCSACFYTIPSQELLRLKRKALVQCKGCFRLLYMEEAMEKIEENEKQS